MKFPAINVDTQATQTPATKRKARPVAAAKPKKISMTSEELAATVQAAVTAALAAHAASVPTQSPAKVKKEAVKEAAKAKKEARKVERKSKNAGVKEEIAALAGVSVDTVTEAFAAAHKFAAEDQSCYKERYDTKLIELIGVPKYNRTSKAA